MKITRSMDAEERIHQQRMGYVKYCIHVKHNILLDSITTNWDTEAFFSQRSDCGKDMPKRKPKVHHIPRHWNRSRRTNGKMAIKKLIATTVSGRESGLKRKEEGNTTSSQMQNSTTGKPTNQQKRQRRRWQRQAQNRRRGLSTMHET